MERDAAGAETADIELTRLGVAVAGEHADSVGESIYLCVESAETVNSCYRPGGGFDVDQTAVVGGEIKGRVVFGFGFFESLCKCCRNLIVACLRYRAIVEQHGSAAIVADKPGEICYCSVSTDSVDNGYIFIACSLRRNQTATVDKMTRALARKL